MKPNRTTPRPAINASKGQGPTNPLQGLPSPEDVTAAIQALLDALDTGYRLPALGPSWLADLKTIAAALAGNNDSAGGASGGGLQSAADALAGIGAPDGSGAPMMLSQAHRRMAAARARRKGVDPNRVLANLRQHGVRPENIPPGVWAQICGMAR